MNDLLLFKHAEQSIIRQPVLIVGHEVNELHAARKTVAFKVVISAQPLVL